MHTWTWYYNINLVQYPCSVEKVLGRPSSSEIQWLWAMYGDFVSRLDDSEWPAQAVGPVNWHWYTVHEPMTGGVCALTVTMELPRVLPHVGWCGLTWICNLNIIYVQLNNIHISYMLKNMKLICRIALLGSGFIILLWHWGKWGACLLDECIMQLFGASKQGIW